MGTPSYLHRVTEKERGWGEQEEEMETVYQRHSDLSTLRILIPQMPVNHLETQDTQAGQHKNRETHTQIHRQGPAARWSVAGWGLRTIPEPEPRGRQQGKSYVVSVKLPVTGSSSEWEECSQAVQWWREQQLHWADCQKGGKEKGGGGERKLRM